MSGSGLTVPAALRPLTAASTIALLWQSVHCPTSTRWRQMNEQTNEQTNRQRHCVKPPLCGGGLTSWKQLRRQGHDPKTLATTPRRPYTALRSSLWSWYAGRWWVGCYIWYSEEGPGRPAAPLSPLLAVLDVTTHPSTASAPTSYYSKWHGVPALGNNNNK